MNNNVKEILSVLKKNRNFIIGLGMVISVLLVAIFANVIAPFKYNEADLSMRLLAPGGKHIFGTDEFGRDVFSRTVYGAPLAFRAALLGTSIELTIGVVVGMIAGYTGGRVDRMLTFIADLIWALPGIIIAMSIIMVIGRSLDNVIIALALAGWPKYARIVRAKTQSLKNMAFVETGIAFGESNFSLMARYIFPNIVPSIVIMASVAIPGMITSTATMSFLGIGAQAPSPDWGLAISSSASLISLAPWLAIFPGIALVYTVFGFSLMGESARDLLDSRQKSQ